MVIGRVVVVGVVLIEHNGGGAQPFSVLQIKVVGFSSRHYRGAARVGDSNFCDNI